MLVRAHAAKKMAKYEKKLRRAAKDFFGHPVAIAYLKPGVMLEIKDTGEKAKIVADEQNELAQFLKTLKRYKHRLKSQEENLHYRATRFRLSQNESRNPPQTR